MTYRQGARVSAGNRAFTLLELAIVLVIIAIVAGISMQMGVSVVAIARLSATQKKMKAIDDALMQFRLSNDRLPCPGDLTLLPGSANYGIEAATPGTCTGGTPTANNIATGTTHTTATAAEGSLPAVTLGLLPDFMVDGWGNKFRYAVDIGYTNPGSFTGNGLSCSNAAITVNDSNATARSTNSVYALISHGPNGHGAYPAQASAMVSVGSTNTNELTNCHCNSSAVATAYAPTYVQMQATVDPASLLDSFDDLVTYKERWQMRTDWDMAGSCGYIYIADSDNDVVRQVSMVTGVITTMAGINGAWGYSGDSGPATSADLHWPQYVAADSSGNLYINDYTNNVIRKVTAATGIITTVAGNGTAGYSGDNGPATTAELNGMNGIALDSSGNLYIADYNNNRIREVTVASGIISTVAGNGTPGYTGDNGPAINAELNQPTGVAVDSSGNFYIADSSNDVVRKVTAATGVITTVAGSGAWSYSGDGGAATSAALDYPGYIAVDSSGNFYFTDVTNNRIRKVTVATGIITTVAGNGTAGSTGDNGLATSAELNIPTGVAVDSSGNIYITDYTHDNRIRKVTAATGIITTFAGNGTAGYSGDGGAATSAELNNAYGVATGR